MKISRVYHKDGHLTQVVTTLPMWQRLAMIAVAAAGMAMAWAVHLMDPDGLKHLIPLALAVIALGMGMGRFVYVIRIHTNVLFRLELFGIPVLSHVVSATFFHRMEVMDEEDGSVTLRFRDAADRPRLTLEGFPTRLMAERIGGFFPIDEQKQSKAVGAMIVETFREEHWFSPWVASAVIVFVFCFTPGLALLMGWKMEDAFFHMTTGSLIVMFSTWVVRRNSGIIAVAEDRSHIDRWTRHGLFRIIEYREHLGHNAGQSMLRIRGDRTVWLFPVLALLQATAVFAICDYHQRQAVARSSLRNATLEIHDPEAVRKGAEMLRKHLEERQKRE